MVCRGDPGGVNRRDRALVLVVVLVWGLNFVVIDVGLGGDDGAAVPPLVFLAVRFLLVVFPAVLLVPRPQAPWRVVAATGLLLSVGQFGFLYSAMAAGLPSGLAALVLQAQVVLTVVIAAGTLGERPAAAQWCGVAVGSGGLVVVGVFRGGDTPLPALLLALGGAASWALGNVLVRGSGVQGGLSLTVWSGLVVPVPLLVLAVALDGPGVVPQAVAAFGLPALLSTLYTAGLASLLGYGIFTGLLSRNPASAVVPWILLVPPVAMTSAALLTGERYTTGEVVGGAVMLGGVLLAASGARWPARLRVRRGTGVPPGSDARQGGADATGREVGAARVDLGQGAEGGVLDLTLLAHDVAEDRPGQLAAVEDQAQGVVPAAPRR